MDPRTKLLLLCFDLILPLAAGYVLARRVSIPERVFNRGMMVGITAVAPTLALASFWCATLTLGMVWIPLLGVLMQLLPGLIGYWRVGRKYSDPLEQGSYLLSVMLSNRGVVGRLSVYFLYGLQGYAYAQLSMLLAPVVVYLFCFPLAQSYRDRHTGAASARSGLRNLFTGWTQMPLLGIAAGLGLNLGGTAAPEWADLAARYLIHVLAWLFVFPLGYAMDFSQMRRYWSDLPELFAIKFLVTPGLICALGWLVGLRADALAAVTVLAASPTAINAVIAARLHQINVHLAMAALISTTTAYILIVLPVILLLLN